MKGEAWLAGVTSIPLCTKEQQPWLINLAVEGVDKRDEHDQFASANPILSRLIFPSNTNDIVIPSRAYV